MDVIKTTKIIAQPKQDSTSVKNPLLNSTRTIIGEEGIGKIENTWISEQSSRKYSEINDSLKKVINNIKSVSGGAYNMSVPGDNNIIRDGNSVYDYNRLSSIKKNASDIPVNYNLGVIKTYRENGIHMVDESIGGRTTMGLPTDGTSDSINKLDVLGKDKTTASSIKPWEPYYDDLIACFFYDVVNEKYIPFRAIISGLQEAGNATWEELPFIGRADKLYSYGGFTRTLTVNIKIVISSITELLPTWQRVNYICTSYKPSNYTVSNLDIGAGNVANRFMVPPMFMLTIGDLYVDQPIIITSVTMGIPDGAAWETINMDNTSGDWKYLANMISAPGVLFGQLPREIDLGFSITLLEKERPLAGGANFGHAPRNDTWSDWNNNTVPNFKTPNKMHQSLVVNVMKK